MQPPKLIHFTEGGPYHSYTDQEFTEIWVNEFKDMLAGNNPCAFLCDKISQDSLFLEITYASPESKT